jgi:hypothetical protein
MNNTRISTTRKSILENRLKGSKMSLLLLVIFTAVNIVLLISQSSTYFLFSATVPYVLVDLGLYWTGMYPPEYYADIINPEFMDSTVFVFMLSIALLIIVFYFLCWLLSKNGRKGWFIAAIVFFSIDTLALFYFYGVNTDMIMDIIFHVWVIVELAMGIHATAELKKIALAEAAAPAPEMQVNESAESTVREDSLPLREADMSAKARVLIKTSALGREIIYRRVKRVNELVIDGKVYADIELFAEPAHSLSAVIDGHDIEVGFDGMSSSYASLNGQIITRKMRLI